MDKELKEEMYKVYREQYANPVEISIRDRKPKKNPKVNS